jgi:hypothetical protein
LTDDDAAASRPMFAAPDGKVLGRVNEVSILFNHRIVAERAHLQLISLASSSDFDETPSKVSQIPPALQKLGFKVTPKLHVKKELKMPSLSLEMSTPVAVKREDSSGTFTPESHADVKRLPAFIAHMWESHFLPALYATLDHSANPMLLGAKGGSSDSAIAAVADIQAIVDAVAPGNTFIVKWGDQICSRVRVSLPVVINSLTAIHVGL